MNNESLPVSRLCQVFLPSVSSRCWLLLSLMVGSYFVEHPVWAQDRPTFEQRLKSIEPSLLADEARKRGDAKRGALVFYTSSAACIKCHLTDSKASPLGPDLAVIGKNVGDWKAFDEHVIESLLYPSKKIRQGFETHQLLTEDGKNISGMIVKETDQELVLRDLSNLEKEITIAKEEIDERRISDKSMMPDGLIASLLTERAFLDLARYIMEVAAGGTERAAALKPSTEQLIVKDDIGNLNHAAILRRLKDDLKSGETIFNNTCSGCHGADGNTPSLATARAFGTQKLKFGADPYSMLLTLSRGNGLMAATTHLSPRERYQVIHYIRERFMKKSNPMYEPLTDKYIDSLPKGTDMGDFKPSGDRDYGPALASQLGKDVSSALTVKLGKISLSYNLHTLDQAGIWQDGFLNLDQTQHQRGRGEGHPQPKGKILTGLNGWQWGHEGSLDYPKEGLLPRGPLPEKWLEYQGHYLYGSVAILNYKIDGREIAELPRQLEGDATAVRHTLRIGPGTELLLATMKFEQNSDFTGVVSRHSAAVIGSKEGAKSSMTMSGRLKNGELNDFVAALALGDIDDATWEVDDQHRSILRIPADTKSRLIEVVCFQGNGEADRKKLSYLKPLGLDPETLTKGGPANWAEELTTVGYVGFETGAYALDTLTVPDSTPWNTWFRTSAIDFFPDGRMAVATTGGDVWIVSGIDDELLSLKWKRFAGGMYEPFGIKVVDGKIYVTCKDRLTRLHDLNGDGEADFYENFSGDTDVSTFFHAFNFDLHTDTAGNFYYAKCGQYTDYALPGAVIKISPDGKTRSVVCTGFRTPNGMGILPDNRLTVSDNQGSWMPASKVSLVKEGGFYGYVQTHKTASWAPDGGRIDTKKVVPPETFDQPIIWMPQDVDNSSGGQIWVGDDRWGPLAGRLLHTSFGKGWMFYLMMQEIDGVSQAAIIKLPHDFNTGIMRGRVNPRDGQVYATGMNGWNENGRPGLKDNGIQRVRYTGKSFRMVSDCQTKSDRLRLTFNFPVDVASASKSNSYSVEQWNYKWRPSYGSEMYHPITDEVGKQSLEVVEAIVSDDRRSVDLRLSDLRPVNQLHLKLDVNDSNGEPFSEEVYWTINRLPK